jgi:hypothetical protein
MDSVWIVFLEVLAFIDAAPTEGKLGLINVVVSAAAADSAVERVSACLKAYGWEILGVERVAVADPDREYGADLPELVEDVTANPHHIRLSTLHSYKRN